jgi:hypothetical protein
MVERPPRPPPSVRTAAEKADTLRSMSSADASLPHVFPFVQTLTFAELRYVRCHWRYATHWWQPVSSAGSGRATVVKAVDERHMRWPVSENRSTWLASNMQRPSAMISPSVAAAVILSTAAAAAKRAAQHEAPPRALTGTTEPHSWLDLLHLTGGWRQRDNTTKKRERRIFFI